MPHFVIEYSKPLEAQVDMTAIMELAYDAGSASGVMNPEDIKVRCRPYDHYRLRTPDETFLHLSVFLLEGRTDEQKEKLAIIAREKLAEALPMVTSISIDIFDSNPVAYKKRLLPLGE
jgi:5-carboxymethyl-2-hydroxymuconate isomerase